MGLTKASPARRILGPRNRAAWPVARGWCICGLQLTAAGAVRGCPSDAACRTALHSAPGRAVPSGAGNPGAAAGNPATPLSRFVRSGLGGVNALRTPLPPRSTSPMCRASKPARTRSAASRVVHFSLPDPGAVLGARRHGRCTCCGSERPEVAAKNGDPFCSTACARGWHGQVGNPSSSTSR